jgi:hypothetical protein
MSENQVIKDHLISQAMQILRFAASQKTAIGIKLARMQQELIDRLQKEDLNNTDKQDVENLINDANKIIETTYASLATTLDVAALSELVASRTVTSMQIAMGEEALAMPKQDYFAAVNSDVLIQGAPIADWWSAQEADTAFKFAAQVRQGLVASETNQQIISRIVGKNGLPGVMDITRKNAASLVQTSVQAVASDARRATFQANSDIINGLEQVSTLDSHTTLICIAYSGAQWDLEYKPINGNTLDYNGGVPRHFNCRSVEIPLTKTFKELGLDIPEPEATTRASEIGQVSEKTTFNDFLERMGTEWQDEVLGPGRAQLWRDGKITLKDLVNGDGQPLTLAELRAKFAN